MRTLLYWLARLLGDINAVKKGKVGKRITRRAAGKVSGKFLKKFFLVLVLVLLFCAYASQALPPYGRYGEAAPHRRRRSTPRPIVYVLADANDCNEIMAELKYIRKIVDKIDRKNEGSVKNE